MVVCRALAGGWIRRMSVQRRRLPQWPVPRCLIAAACFTACFQTTSSYAGDGRIEPAAKLDVTYRATLLGLPIGHIVWTIEVHDNRFSAVATGVTAGLLQVFSPGHGIAEAHGMLTGPRPAASKFMVAFSHGSASEQIKILFSDGKATPFFDRPPPPNPNLIPLTDAYKSGVVDPMTALLIRVPGTGDTAVPTACEQKIAVFDGRMRYDLQLAYKRIERVRADAGYDGPAVVCAVYFTPLAGYDPTRSAIKYLRAERGMEMWLAPLSGTRLMVPFRVLVPTPLGDGVLQATRFIWMQHSGHMPG